jgi:predicted deacylase
MPFMYEVTLAADEPEYLFLQQLVPAGTLVGTGQAIAVLSGGSDAAMEFHLPAPKQGLLVGWYVERGDAVRAGEPLARIVCEGDEVAVSGAVPVRLG